MASGSITAVKWFSWSALVYLLSLLFIWSCGYWLLLQSSSWQLQQQQAGIGQQLEKAVSLMQNWQQGYQLHLAYLQTHAQPVSSQTQSTPLVDPLQEIDDSIRRVLWPDPLLAYAVLDQDQRVLRFSSAVASHYFSQTRIPTESEQVFLRPLVFPEQWVMPLRVIQSGQTLLLWFDATKLQQQLQQLTLSFNHATEFMFLDQQAELYSRSRYQTPLLARLGQNSTEPYQALRLYAKRPPENLLHSKQRYLDAGVWPLTSVVQQLHQSASGFLASHYLNYLGRPSLAAWQYLSQWQLYAVIERDASLLLADLAKLKQRLLFLLGAITVLITLIFWWLHRRMQVAIALQPLSSDWPDPVESDELAAKAVRLAVSRPDPAAAVLLEAWSKQAGADPQLADLSRHWLQRQSNPSAQLSWVCPLAVAFTERLQRWQQHHPLPLSCRIDSSVPALVRVEQQAWFDTLQLLLQASTSRDSLSGLQLTLSLPSSALLQLDIADQASPEPAEHWQTWLQLATRWSDTDAVELEPQSVTSSTADFFRLLGPLLQAMGGQLEWIPQSEGNLLRWSTPVTVPTFQPTLPVATVTGRAMLLCPSGVVQQHYQQLLLQAGLELLPLDDSQQLMQWCAGKPLPLDKLVIDEVFVKSDPHLAFKVAQVVRRYFPQVQVLLAMSQPERWLQLQQELVLIPKPCTWLVLQQAFLQQQGLVRLQRPKVWLYLPDPLELWWLQQMCHQLGVDATPITSWPQLPGDMQQDGYCLPWELHLDLSGPVLPARLLWCLPAQSSADIAPTDSWHMTDGPAALSEKLYQRLTLPTAVDPSFQPEIQASSPRALDESTAS
jgi:hypothetical protein